MSSCDVLQESEWELQDTKEPKKSGIEILGL